MPAEKNPATPVSESTHTNQNISGSAQLDVASGYVASGYVASGYVASESRGPIDVRSLMADIRSRVKKEIEMHGRSHVPFRPTATDPATVGSRKAGELLHSEELRYLNSHYSFSSKLSFDGLTSHRRGFVGRTIVAVKRKLIRIIFDSLLKEYFAAERDFNANLVRMLNDVSKYVDARDASNFWELIRKIDVDVTRALDRVERLADEYGASLRSTEKRVFEELYRGLQELNVHVTAVQGSTERHEQGLRTLDSVARGLEGAIARLSVGRKGSVVGDQTDVVPADQSYVLLENRYRGSESEISTRLDIYPELCKGSSLPVLEIGSGRGELQLLFRAAGIQSYGIDTDEAMTQVARERGVATLHGDGMAHLRSVADGSLGGVIAVQVVEHLTRQQLAELMALCAAKVAHGGKVIFETINPQSMLALSSNYFRDPTHVWPLHPDTLSYMMTLAGLHVAEVRMLSPVPEGAVLKTLPVEEYMTPRWMELVGLFNHNITQLNSLLYGYQDYCVVAEVR